MTDTDDTQPGSSTWGRVDDDGIVYVRDGEGERAVGAYPGATPHEALAYYERKFTDLESQVTILEQRVKHGAPGKKVKDAITRLQESVRDAHAVGDLRGLEKRLEALHESAVELTEKQVHDARVAVEQSVTARTHIVEKLEKLVTQDPQKIQWKKASKDVEALFEQWQGHQQRDPRIPSATADNLWERFRTARGQFERMRRTYFAELDVAQAQARTRKEGLIAKAEALAPKGAEGIPSYRSLLDSWKKAGAAGRRHEDELWERFKKAGDVLYADKSEIDARENEEWQANLEKKMALLDEAQPLLTATDRTEARGTLRAIQRRWDEIGKVPRDKVRPIEDRMRKIEDAVRRLEEEHWRAHNPEKQARSEGLAAQLHEAIGQLEADLATAQEAGDTTKVAELESALEARRQWLKAIEP